MYIIVQNNNTYGKKINKSIEKKQFISCGIENIIIV